MHLHALRLTVPGYQSDGSDLQIDAPLPSHIRLTLEACQLDEGGALINGGPQGAMAEEHTGPGEAHARGSLPP
jgi:hypothetical protein